MNNDNLKLLKEAQEQVICHLVNDKNLYLSHGKRLFPELFKIPELREIYSAYESVFKEGKKPDFISLSKKVSFQGGFSYITKLLSKINFNTHFLTSVEFLIEHHTKGSLMGIGASIVSKINDGHESNEIVGFIQTELVNMTKVNHKPIKDMSTHLVEMIKNIEKNMQEQGITGIGTGFRLWDKFSGGLHTSDLFIMA